MWPARIRTIVQNNRICCLATLNDDEPYLSMMFYTPADGEEYLIMTSQADTAKVRNMSAYPKASLLIHDTSDPGHPIAVTLSGNVEILEGERAAQYLAMHQKARSLSSPFIKGSNVAVIGFRPVRALIADQEDRVQYWQAE